MIILSLLLNWFSFSSFSTTSMKRFVSGDVIFMKFINSIDVSRLPRFGVKESSTLFTTGTTLILLICFFSSVYMAFLCWRV